MKLQDNEIAIIWSAEDVKQECEWLTDEQALDVLQAIEHRHDACIGQFLFNVQAFNLQEPFLMRVKYQDIGDIKVMNYRELTKSNWEGKILEDIWTKEVSTNIQFNRGFTKADLKSQK